MSGARMHSIGRLLGGENRRVVARGSDPHDECLFIESEVQ